MNPGGQEDTEVFCHPPDMNCCRYVNDNRRIRYLGLINNTDQRVTPLCIPELHLTRTPSEGRQGAAGHLGRAWVYPDDIKNRQ
ncbi:MAG TPA: hypothetical protein VEU33_16775, partial [Archangium sp.]|nr:hypothetical protein [Archangium sp.]